MAVINGTSVLGAPQTFNFPGTLGYYAIAINQADAGPTMRIGGLSLCLTNVNGIFRYESHALYGTGHITLELIQQPANSWRLYLFWRNAGIRYTIYTNT